MAGNRIIEFVDEGVRFILPSTLDGVFIERLTTESIDRDKHFTPGRFVLEVLMFKKANKNADIPKFEQKLKLLVNFDQGDVDRAQSKDKTLKFPVLGIYDGKRWHKPGDTEGKVTYGPPFSAGRWVGSVELAIEAWNDPGIGWGP